MSITYTFEPGWTLSTNTAPAANPNLVLPWPKYTLDFVPVESTKDTQVYKCLKGDLGVPLALTIQSRKVANVYANVPQISAADKLPNVSGQAVYINMAGVGNVVQTVTAGAESKVMNFAAPINASLKIEVPANPAFTHDVVKAFLLNLVNTLWNYQAQGTANTAQLDALLRGSRALPT